VSLENKLDRVLELIDYRRTIVPVEHKLQHLSAQFTLQRNRVESNKELDDILATFGLLMMQGFYGAPTAVLADYEFNRHEAFHMLSKKYDYHTIYDIALSGAEGGLRHLLDVVCRELVNDYSQRMISSHVSRFWHSLSTDEQISVSDIYLHKFRDILPLNQSQYHWRVKMRFWEVLERHPAMMKKAAEMSG
jgi:hypothetical protein